MSSVQVTFVKLDVVPGQEDAFIDASLLNAAGSREEPTNFRFDLLRSLDDPTKFILVEVYSSEDGPKDHKANAHYLTWRETVADMMATPRKGVGCVPCCGGDGWRRVWNTQPTGWPEPFGPLNIAVVDVHVKPGSEEAFRAASLENAAGSSKEPGNLRFDLVQQKEDPTRFMLFEVYQNAEAVTKHKETAHYLKWRETVQDMMAEPRVGKKYEAIGLTDPWAWAAPGRPVPLTKIEADVFQLNDGSSIPSLGFGCYKVGVIPGSSTTSAGAAPPAPAWRVIGDALAAGYRCFDCSHWYENEVEIGAALDASALPREELYIMSKCWTTVIFNGPEAVKQRVRDSLRDLRTDYFDLYFIHWPVPGKHVEAYAALIELKEEGIIKSVGVSNYTVEDVEELVAAGLPVPSVNQIEINPFLYRKNTIAYMQEKGIRLQAYRALTNFGKNSVMANDVVQQIAQKHGKSGSQVLGRWCIQQGFQHIPKSERRARMEENAAIFNFKLDEDDFALLDGLTTPESLETFKTTYIKCAVRDTPLDVSASRTEFTLD